MIWSISLLTVFLVIIYCLRFFLNEKNQQDEKELAILTCKYAFAIYIVLCCLIAFFNCFQRVQPGEVGVVVDLLGSNKGVEDVELHVGYHFIKPWCDIYKFPIFEQNHQWTGNEGFNFQTSEGLSVHADIGITFNLQPDHIHDLFAKYRRGMDEITHLFIRNNIGDAINKAASKMKIEQLYGTGKEQFFDEVQNHLRTELKPLGFNINHLFIIGQFHVPANVMSALNSKIEATQRAQQRENELREAEAQARKEVAIQEGASRSKIIKAEADARANKLVSQSLTRELLNWEAVHKWDGKLPQVVGTDMPFIMQLNGDK